MSTNVEAVLALLPELFPGTQPIPLSNIRPNPQNPGPALADQEIQDLADNLAALGLVNPIKVMPDRERLFAGGASPHPDNPRLNSNGKPWVPEDFNWVILAGEGRYRAAGRLRWATLKAFILNPTAEEAVEITHLDNAVRERGWWAGYQSIEQLIQANPRLTQRQVAAKLKMNKDKVTRAIGLLPLLNAEGRGLIVRHSDNSNKGIWGISELAASRLADLGPGPTLKRGVKKEGDDSPGLWPYPAIPAETQDLVQRTLQKAFDLELTEAGVKGLVGWVKEGHKPEDYQPGAQRQQPEIPTSQTEPIGSAPRDDRKDSPDEEDEDYEPIPWSEASKHPEYMTVPTARTRIHSFIANVYAHSWNLERIIQAMKMTGVAKEIRVRRLTEAEKAADPDHDYELFDGYSSLKGAQRLGWPSLRAMVYDIDEWEGVRIHNFEMQHSTPLTWIEKYIWVEKRLEEDPSKTVADWAVPAAEDPILVEKLLPVLKLLNDPAQEAICRSVHRAIEGMVDNGEYRFTAERALALGRLKNFSRNLAETQKLVEKVVLKAIEHELRGEDLEELVDWALAGKDPAEFEVEVV